MKFGRSLPTYLLFLVYNCTPPLMSFYLMEVYLLALDRRMLMLRCAHISKKNLIPILLNFPTLLQLSSSLQVIQDQRAGFWKPWKSLIFKLQEMKLSKFSPPPSYSVPLLHIASVFGFFVRLIFCMVQYPANDLWWSSVAIN